MFFVQVEGVSSRFVVGGACTLGGAKKLAENRAKHNLSWKETETGYLAVVEMGASKTYYTIEQRGSDGN